MDLYPCVGLPVGAAYFATLSVRRLMRVTGKAVVAERAHREVWAMVIASAQRRGRDGRWR